MLSSCSLNFVYAKMVTFYMYLKNSHSPLLTDMEVDCSQEFLFTFKTNLMILIKWFTDTSV